MAESSASTATPEARDGGRLAQLLSRERLVRSIKRLAEFLANPARARHLHWYLCGPLAAFLLTFFLFPLLYLLHVAMHNPSLSDGWPQFIEALHRDTEISPGQIAGVPGEEVFRILALELRQLPEEEEAYRTVLKPFSQQDPEIWRLFDRTVKALPEDEVPSMAEWFKEFDEAWGEPDTWQVIRRIAAPYTIYYFVDALDGDLLPGGSVRRKPPERLVFGPVIRNTLVTALAVTILALILGYPVAYLLANLAGGRARVLLGLVLMPLWLAVVVKTFAWLLILSRQGLINSTLIGTGTISEPLPIIPGTGAVTIALVYIALPFMVLPIYGVMRGIPPQYLRAALSLGASPVRAVFTTYLPHTWPGVAAGCLLVFFISIGNYVTPVLTGGANHRVVSVVVSDYTLKVGNYGAAAALACTLLFIVLALYFVYFRVLGEQRVRAI